MEFHGLGGAYFRGKNRVKDYIGLYSEVYKREFNFGVLQNILFHLVKQFFKIKYVLLVTSVIQNKIFS